MANQKSTEILGQKIDEFRKTPEGQRHNAAFPVAFSAWYAGYREVDSLTAQLTSIWNKIWGDAKEDEIRGIAKFVIDKKGEQGTTATVNPIKTSTRKSELLVLQNGHRSYWQNWINDILASSSELKLDSCAPKNTLDFLKKICGDIEDGEYVFVGQKTGENESNFIDSRYDIEDIDNQNLFCPNKLNTKSRKKDNCLGIRYLVLEIDEPLTQLQDKPKTATYFDNMEIQQSKLWNYLVTKIPIKCITYSGGKSLHALVAVNGTVSEFMQKREDLARLYLELHFDYSNLDAVRKTRCPYTNRWWAKMKDETFVEYDDVFEWKRLAGQSKLDADKAKNAQDKLDMIDSHGPIKQDLLFWAENVAPIGLDEYEDALETIVREFAPECTELEKQLQAGKKVSMNYVNFCDYLRISNQKLWFDEITREEICEGFLCNNSNVVPTQIQDGWLEKTHCQASIDKINANMALAFNKNTRNTVLEWLNGLTWDNVDRISELNSILGINNDLQKTLMRKWLFQCVAMAYNDGTYGADGVLTLYGKQGIGKTSFFAKLAVKDAWFNEGRGLDVENKDSLTQLTKGWIMELGEVDSTTKKEQDRLKAVITAKCDELRLSYDRRSTRFVRHVSLCATVNKNDFLRDVTGNRRWWTVQVNKIDIDALNNLDIEQLWAQVHNEWQKASDKQAQQALFRLTQSEQEHLSKSNENFRMDSGWEATIAEKFNMTMPESEWEWHKFGDIANLVGSNGFLTQRDKNDIAKSLRAMKFEERKTNGQLQFRVPINSCF